MISNVSKEFVKFQIIRGISFTSDKVPRSFHNHWHSAAEFMYITRDDCKVTVEDEEYTLNKGDVFLVWPRQHHSIISNPDNGIMLVQFASGLVENNLDLTSSARFLYECHRLELKKEPEITSYVSERLRLIGSLYENKEYFSESKSKLAVCEILLKLGEFVIDKNQENILEINDMDPSTRRIMEALSYIDEHAVENITQNDVADQVGLSPYYFSRLFKKHAGKNFPAYLSEVRVKIAMAMLTDGSMSITEVAFQSGFQSITAFNKVFRSIMGCTPREYRKLNIHQKRDI